MKPKTLAILIAALVAAVIAALVVWDIVVVTDQERLEAFADLVTSEVSPENIEAAMAYVDPAVQPIVVEVRHQTLRFDKDNRDDFSLMARGRLRPYHGIKQHVMRKSVDVRDSQASINTETFSRQGRVSVDWELRKRGEGWWVSRVALR